MRNHLCLFLSVLLFLSGCASLPTDVERKVSSHSDHDGEPSHISANAGPYLRAHPGESGFWLLGNGLDAFAARILLAEAAERTIDVQYFVYRNDLVGRALTYYLLRAADRGVRVRLLLDDNTTKGIDPALAALDSHPSIEVRIINPFANRKFRGLELLNRFNTVSRRMHNKSFSVDNVMTIVGGRNVGDEYYAAHENVNFGDIDVLAVGPAAMKVGTQFDKYWNSEITYPIRSLTHDQGGLDELRRDLKDYVDTQRHSPYAQRIRTSDLVQRIEEGTLEFQWGHAIVFYDLPQKLITDPEDRSTHLGPRVRRYAIGNVERELLIFNPYFIPGEEGVASLTELAKRGVKVRVLTNSLASTDVGLVHARYAKYRKPLLRGGVEIYELKPDADIEEKVKPLRLKGSSGASLHAKTAVFDRNALFVGSANLDPRSGKLNTEVGILFESEPLAVGLADWFDNNWGRIAYRVTLDQTHCSDGSPCEERLRWTEFEGDQEVVYATEPKTSALTRLLFGLVSLLPIESQL